MEGTTVNMTNGYPTGDTNLAAAAGLDANDYTFSAASGVLTVSPKGVATASNCQFTYTNATGTSTPPVISPTASSSGCN
jgi:MSHA pilin protein MshA